MLKRQYTNTVLTTTSKMTKPVKYYDVYLYIKYLAEPARIRDQYLHKRLWNTENYILIDYKTIIA